MKKTLSILLALIMLISSVPLFASAADPIALTEANITTYPTATGEMYFGEYIYEKMTLVGGEVQYNGTTVPGTFSFSGRDLTTRPPAHAAYRANFTFTPENTDEFTGFSVSNSRNVTFTVNKVTPVLADETQPPVVSGTVEAGTTLSSLTIEGGTVMNPYYHEESQRISQKWEWSSPDTVLLVSGYYEAKIASNNSYNEIVKNIWVEVEGNFKATTISEAPTVNALTYDGTTTWADVALVGGKAVEEGTETEVPGTFAMTKLLDIDMSYWNDKVVSAGTHEVAVTFTPDDTEKYLSSSTTVTVEVAKAPFKFLDENGAEIVPEITVPYGTTYKNLEPQLKVLKTNSSAAVISYSCNVDNEKYVIPVGENEIDVTASPGGDKNVETTTVKVKVTVEPATVPMTIQNVHTDEELALNERLLRVAKVNSSDATPKGSYDVYADDVLIADDVTGTFKWLPTETKEYTLRVVYNPTENDPCIVEEFTQAYPVTMTRIIKSSGNASAPVRVQCGDEVTVYWSAAAEDFKGWSITDADGNEVDLGVDLSSDKITFTMPDYDLVIAEYCDHLCHSDFFLAKIIWKMLNIIFRLFDVQQYCDCGNLHYDAPFFG